MITVTKEWRTTLLLFISASLFALRSLDVFSTARALYPDKSFRYTYTWSELLSGYIDFQRLPLLQFYISFVFETFRMTSPSRCAQEFCLISSEKFFYVVLCLRCQF